MKINLEIVTPVKSVYKDDVDEVVAPTSTGQITILPNHVGLLTKIEPGELIVKKNNSIQSIAITGGFLEIGKNKLTILADYAVRAEDIEVAKVEKAKERAEKLLEEKTAVEDFAKLEGELRKTIIELKVARKRRGPMQPTPETSQ